MTQSKHVGSPARVEDTAEHMADDGEDEELDFASDTAYDSYRTGATGSLRARSTPLDSMFEESPPSSGSRSKMADFHEVALMSAFRNDDEYIAEEEEGVETPIKYRLRSEVKSSSVNGRNDDDFVRSSPLIFATPTAELLSLGDDEDEDWTKDDDDFDVHNPLPPPNTSFHQSLASNSLRHHQNVFDWSETHMNERLNGFGSSIRPNTAHGKQVMDIRGGRAMGRRPTAFHVRSQSVPAVPDVIGAREFKVPKFGTWGLGAKGVSEDWDNDFEFDCVDGIQEERDVFATGAKTPMFVPHAIQASQATVVGHVGQIREVCLLVEDLRRLRGLAKEKGIIDGPSADKWREAEGIIALAIPDEEDETLSLSQPPAASATKAALNSSEKSSITAGLVDADDDSVLKDNQNMSESFVPRRQSILAMEDDIFGFGSPRRSPDGTPLSKRHHHTDLSEVARSVMENLNQHRATSDPIISRAIASRSSKMPFDTTSLRDLVQRANALTRALSEIIRKADGFTHSPTKSPPVLRDISPAFTRVFTDPQTSPSKNMHRSQSDNTLMAGTTIDSSPTRNLSRMQMMAVI